MTGNGRNYDPFCVSRLTATHIQGPRRKTRENALFVFISPYTRALPREHAGHASKKKKHWTRHERMCDDLAQTGSRSINFFNDRRQNFAATSNIGSAQSECRVWLADPNSPVWARAIMITYSESTTFSRSGLARYSGRSLYLGHKYPNRPQSTRLKI